ncbi:hypothetical protein [Paenilisteria newyorkensis]|uniref:hypothetical protein n=1 Tax=Listeria newyorkensis TaxID=1497681 RepID=UPI0023592CDE|nr:hypothetical protein [Listeria newyorkensis]WAO21740.1 hypothetical protein OTR81_00060 [Listeria newyorkensis]
MGADKDKTVVSNVIDIDNYSTRNGYRARFMTQDLKKDKPEGSEVAMDNNKYDLFMQELKEDMRERENRNENRQRDSEARTETRQRDAEDRLEKSLDSYRNEAKEREERFQKTADEIKGLVNEMKSSNKSTAIAIWTLSIATILGIAAMIVSILITK